MTVPIPPEATTTDSRLADQAATAASANPSNFLDSHEALHKLMDRKGGALVLQQMLVEATIISKFSFLAV